MAGKGKVQKVMVQPIVSFQQYSNVCKSFEKKPQNSLSSYCDFRPEVPTN